MRLITLLFLLSCSSVFADTYVLSRGSFGVHSRTNIWAPQLYLYCKDFTVKHQRGVKNWTLCIVPVGATIAPGALSDPFVKIIPDSRLDIVLTGARLTAANNWISGTDLGITFTTGMTVREALKTIGVALGHGNTFEDSLR